MTSARHRFIVRSLCEAVAHITRRATESGYKSGNSAQDIDNYIEWAIEFEQLYYGINWGLDMEYIDTINDFVDSKIKVTT